MKIKKFNEFNIRVPKEIEELSNIFTQNGHKLFIVGGYIRDSLMGLKPLDIDLATDSLPDETISFLKGKYRIDLVGKSFGVIIVDIGKMKIEIASFRKDVSKGRHPEVKLGVTIEDDVQRRDLTISALFYDIKLGEVVDLVGGVSDIKNHIIRMVGNPIDRIEEDQLRSLRVIRFSCRYDFSIDTQTLSDLKKYTDLSQISRERIWEEMYKSYKQCSDYSKYLKLLTELNLWSQIFPDSKINTKVIKCNSLEVYLANLFKDEKANQNKLVQKYLIPIEISRVVTFLISFQNFEISKLMEFWSKKSSYRISNDMIKEWIDVAGLDDLIYSKFLTFKPSISAADLMAKGFKNAALGNEIRKLEIEKFNQI